MVTGIADVGILDNVTQQFILALKDDYHHLLGVAKTLFFLLAGLQVVGTAIWLMFKDSPIEAAVKALQVAFMLTIFYTLMTFGSVWMPEIINGFIDAGSQASGVTALSPSSVMDQGVSIGFAILDNFSNWGWVTHPFGSLLAVVILAGIIIVYAFIAAEMAIIVVKSYTLTSLSGLMFAFGGHETTRPIAVNYFKAVIGIGLQLLTFYLLMGVGVAVGKDWSKLIEQAAANHELKPFLVVLSAVIVFYLVIKNVPPFVAGLSGISGFRNHGDAAVGAALTTATTTVNVLQNAAKTGGKAVQGTAQAIKGGAQAAEAFKQHRASGASSAKAAGKTFSNTASAMGKAVQDNVMKRNQGMSFGQKVNSHMSSQNAQHAVKASKATSDQAPGPDFKSNTVKKP